MRLELSSAAEMYLQNMHLNTADEEAVRNCIAKYTQPNNFLDGISWLFFRITEVVKKVLGCLTQWQIAENLVLAKAQQLADCNDISTQDLQKLKETVSKCLNFCLKMNHISTPITNEMRQELNDCDLQTQIRSNSNNLSGERNEDFFPRLQRAAYSLNHSFYEESEFRDNSCKMAMVVTVNNEVVIQELKQASVNPLSKEAVINRCLEQLSSNRSISQSDTISFHFIFLKNRPEDGNFNMTVLQASTNSSSGHDNSPVWTRSEIEGYLFDHIYASRQRPRLQELKNFLFS